MPKGKFATQQFSITDNISAGGLLFISSEPIPISSIIELRIALPDTDKPIECLGKVLRVEEAVAGKTYNISVCFLYLGNGNSSNGNISPSSNFGGN